MNTQVPFPTGKCNISDDWTYKGMQVIRMENDFLRIGILAGRGSDIFEFRYKPLDLDYMLRLNKEIMNPNVDFSQQRGTNNQFEDYYYGGWQEILPNSPALNYRGAHLGQHGEVSLTPWKYAVLETGPERISVKLWTRPLRMPLLIEKTLTLEADKSILFIDERLTNESATHLDVVWGHHIAFGLPFLLEGARIHTNASGFYAEPLMPENRRFMPGVGTAFPEAVHISGGPDDAGRIDPESAPPYSDLAYLSGFGEQAWYSIVNEEKKAGFTVRWDGNIFKHVWYWMERYGTKDAPWWGNTYAIALEPWTNRWRSNPHEGIEAGEWLRLEKGESVETKLEAEGFHY